MNDFEDVTVKYHSSIGSRLNFWWYWNVKHRIAKIGQRIIWKLPRRVVYWCIIRAAVEVEPDCNPSLVTAEEMLDKFDYN